MAIAYRQSRSLSAAGVTSLGLAYTSNPLTGSLLIADEFDGGGLNTTIGCSDTINGSWGAKIIGDNLATDHDTVGVFAFLVSGTGAADTVTVTGTGISGMAITEVTGFTSPVLDKSAHSNATGTAATSGNTATTTAANEYLHGSLFTSGSGDAFGTAGGKTLRENNPTAHIATQSLVLAATGAQSADFTISPSDEYVAICATFMEGAAAPSFLPLGSGILT